MTAIDKSETEWFVVATKTKEEGGSENEEILEEESDTRPDWFDVTRNVGCEHYPCRRN